jgi:predicted nucleic acid-binding protein
VSFYPDANFILAVCAHSDDPGAAASAERALRWLARRELAVSVSPLAVYEARKQLWGLPEENRKAAEERLDLYLSEWDGVVTGWAEAIDSALLIAREFRQRLAVDSADTLHVGWAQAEQCTVFGSFDTASGARALAHARGLKVWPEMKEADFQHLARLKGQK